VLTVSPVNARSIAGNDSFAPVDFPFARPMTRPQPGLIGLVDYGMGNRRSVEKALEQSASPVVVRYRDDLRPLGGIGAVLRF